MIRSARLRVELRRSLELSLWCSLICVAVISPLVLGQILRLREILWPLSGDHLRRLTELMLGGSLILLEVALPLAILGGVTLSVRRWRAQGEYLDWWLIGGSPIVFLRPVIILALVVTTLNIHLTESVTPRTIRALRDNAMELGLNKWRSLVPQMLSKAHPNISTRPSIRSRHFLIESNKPYERDPHVNKGSERRVFTYIMCSPEGFLPRQFQTQLNAHPHREQTHSASCLTTWWRENDERKDTVTLHNLRLNSSTINLSIDHFELSFFSAPLSRIKKTFGPPNSLDSPSLNKSVHHRFIYLKRRMLPLLCLLFAVIASWAGLSLNAVRCAVVNLTAVGIGFGGLRGLELWSRAGGLSPELAASLPTLLLATFCAWMLRDIYRRHPQPI